MTENLINSDCSIVVPSSTLKGAGIGKCQKLQGIDQIPDLNININDPNNYQKVQDFMIDNNLFENQKVEYTIRNRTYDASFRC